MLPSYILVVDIVAPSPTISEEQFRSQVEPCLSHLSALKGAFDRSPCTITYYPPGVHNENPDNEVWSVRGLVMISVGKARAEYLNHLYKAMMRLITLELPDFEVHCEASKFEFS
ncbi:MAG TPA: hypothetical protein DHV22_09945 [Xanthomarina gelatinilytica]|uniref:Uncharacterized protein n=1 Tax=Xanthomarina gelatinilytica TaxID=1137281 RepID=A0A3D6BSJ8_9FLAO|nr:hypothetical protein [Xanthomarina gelatinilytica]